MDVSLIHKAEILDYPHREDERRYMDYLFVSHEGWYLKQNKEKIIDYHKKTENHTMGLRRVMETQSTSLVFQKVKEVE